MAFKQHRSQFPACNGDLKFDLGSEQQHGLCWRERLTCVSCGYASDFVKLYEEVSVSNSSPGVKAAKPNVGVQVALSKLPVGSDAVRTICMAANIPPPSESGMQKTANKTLDLIKAINEKDMSERRGEIKEINKLRGNVPNVVNVEGDGMYNNPLYSGVGKTPFQPATQSTYVICEQVTSKKEVIALSCHNKLCTKKHDISDSKACLEKSCSRNTAIETSIGNEKEWAKECLLDLKKDDLEVEYITTDPDSAAYRAADELFEGNITSTRPFHLIDTRHLSENHRKFVGRSEFVKNMMPGKTKSMKELMQSRFSVDISKRCQLEYEKAFEVYAGNTNKIFRSISYTCEAIAACYQGNHAKCIKHSLACKGGKKNWVQRSPYLEQFSNFKIIASDENTEYLLKCINYRLGPSMLRKTKFNTNSQKSEAVNKCLRRSLPRDTTFGRNFAGRAHSAVHSVNLGAAESIVTLTEKLGCAPTPRSKVAVALKKKRDKQIMHAEYKLTPKYKANRASKTRKMFRLHEKKNKEAQYSKGMLLRHKQQAPEHNYSKKCNISPAKNK